MSQIQLHIEAMIFAATSPVKVTEIKDALEKVFEEETFSEEQIKTHIENITEKCKNENSAFELRKSGGGFQFLTKHLIYDTVAILLNLKAKRRLTRSALETLAIIAYKQPITKSEIEAIRGVNCDYAVQKLLEKELVKVDGRAETVGKPLLYATNETFMDYFGINSKEELPTLKEFQTADQQIGEAQE